MISRIKTGDTVVVISGKDKGKKGAVIKLDFKQGKALVGGVAIVTKHKKSRQKGQGGQRIAEEQFIHVAKVMPWCGSCQKPARVSAHTLSNNKNVRACARCKSIV
jgi:large subunit ribosomal protein L24